MRRDRDRRRFALAVLALSLVACGAGAVTQRAASEPPPQAAPSAPPAAESGGEAIEGTRRSPSPDESKVIAELMRSAQRVRKLRFMRPVPVLVEDRARITQYVASQIEEEELQRAQIVYTALGLLPAGLDVRGLLLRLMGEQVVGYYDTDDKHLVVRDDVMRGFAVGADQDDESGELAEARIVLVHELVHALQDQNLDLNAHIHEERDTDASNALHALVEGDATLAMIGYALEREHIPLHRLTGNPAQVRSFSDVVRHSPLAGSELEQAPAIVRVPLLSSYVDGLAFCASLHGVGGFAAVDRAHRHPPVSTEQVLHPARYARGDVPTSLSLPDLPELDEAGYELVREDTLGELEMRVYFGQGVNDEEAARAADGWDGDRIRVYHAHNGASAVVWLTVWDSELDAQQASDAATQVLRAGSAALRAHSSVVRSGASVLVLRDVPEGTRARLSARLLGRLSQTGPIPQTMAGAAAQ